MTDEAKEEKSERALMAGNEKAASFLSESHASILMHRASDLPTPAADPDVYLLSCQLYTHTPYTYTHHTHAHAHTIHTHYDELQRGHR